MKLTTLIDELNNDSTKWISRSQKPIEIYSYELYLADSVLQTGIAYVCDYSSLPDLLPPQISLLCVGVPENVDIQPSDCNVISFSGEIMALLRDVGIQMTNEHKLQADKQTLLETLNSRNGLQGLVDAAYCMLNNPIIVVDSAYKILAMKSTVIEDRPDLEFQRQLGYMVDKNIDSMKQARIYEKIRLKRYPNYDIDESNFGWLISLIYVYGIEAAQIGVMEYDHDFTHYDYEITHFLCKLISLELQKNDFYKHDQTLMHSTLMADLLGGKLHDETAFTRARQLGWKLSKAMYIMTIFDRNYGIFDHRARVICDRVHSLFTNSQWLIQENKIVFLLILSSDDDELNIWAALKEYLSNNRLSASVSDQFSDLYSVKWKYTQCEAAYNLGIRLNPTDFLYFYKDYNVYHIGSVVLNELPATVIFHPGVIDMEKYDRENGTGMFVTLKEYLSIINDPGAVAKKLFIHKNTLFYRINKAKELFGFDLNNGYERMRIYMTMLLMEL